MSWTYWDWVLCNILIGVGIVLCTYLVLGLLLWRFDQLFYSIIEKLFNITRAIIDVHHTVIKDNSRIFTSKKSMSKTRHFFSKVCQCCGKTNNETDMITTDISTITHGNFFSRICNCAKVVVTEVEEESIKAITSNSSKMIQTDQKELDKKAIDIVEPVSKINIEPSFLVSSVNIDKPEVTMDPLSSSTKQLRTTINTEFEISKDNPSHKGYVREILNLYGRYLTLNKKINKFLIMTISVIVISSVLIAAVEGCLLASTTVYPESPCPVYGIMECFHGSNYTYFECIPGDIINFTLYSDSATCFRWIARDTTITDAMTQIGVCTGILTAFGSVVEVLIRLLLFVFQQRRGIAAGIRRLMEKTVGINRITQPNHCFGHRMPFHFGIFNLNLYQRPWLVIIFIIIYILLPVCVVSAIILLSYFRISITSLTYIILLTVVLICCLALLWVLWEEDEMGRIIPGAWTDSKDIFGSHHLKKFAMLAQHAARDNSLTVTGSVKDTDEKFNTNITNTFSNINDQQFTKITQNISSISKGDRQSTNSTEQGHLRKNIDKSKDVRYIHSRKN